MSKLKSNGARKWIKERAAIIYFEWDKTASGEKDETQRWGDRMNSQIQAIIDYLDVMTPKEK